MSKFKPQYARLVFIDRKIREGKYPNSTTLAREYEVSPRSIARDIAYLKDMLGAPVEYDPARKGYFYSEDDYRLPDIQIRESDFFALMIADRALSMYENTPMYNKLRQIFGRLLSLLPDTITVNSAWINEKYSFLGESIPDIDSSVWENLNNALRAQITLRIVHRSPGKQESSRLVDPYHMASYRGEWYLVGRCHTRKDVLKFAVSRIKAAECTDKPFDIPHGFDFSTYLGPSFGIMTETEEYDIAIRFNAATAPYIRERSWHRDQTITEEDNGEITLSFKTNSLIEVKRWVLSWGDGAKVTKPVSLARIISGEIARMAGQYGVEFTEK